MGFFSEFQQHKELTARMAESMGGVYSDPFNETAMVVSVSDPKKLGRVKVEYQDGTTSDWAYVLGSGKGVLSAQLIGSSCLVGKAHGNSGDAFILGFFNKNPNITSGGTPLQLQTLNVQSGAYPSPQSTGDQGLRCNPDQGGRVYLLDDGEMSPDVVVCMRRNIRQDGGEDVWNWKSLTNSKWVEKGQDSGIDDPQVSPSGKTGIPDCGPGTEGDVHDFTEDRKFRTFQIKCGRDENGDYTWKSVSALRIAPATLLPKCTEKLHGESLVYDDGLNSQVVTCLRYQGELRWVITGSRNPLQLHRNDRPLTREEFLNSKNPVEALKSDQKTGMKSGDWVGNSAKEVLQMAAKAIPAALPTTPLGVALKAAGALSGAFDGAKLLTDIAKTVIVNNGTLPVSSLVSQISSSLERAGIIDDTTQSVIKTLGDVGDQLVRGVKNGTVNSALENVGRKALNQSIRTLSPETSSVYFGYMAGGIAGAMDATAALKLPFIPDEINDVIKPALSIGAGVLRLQPQAVNKVLGGATGQSGSVDLNQTLSTIGTVVPMTAALATGVSSLVKSGDLGEVASTLTSFATALPTIAKFAGGGDLPKLASTALQAIGLGKQFVDVFKGGISLDGVGKLLGTNPVTGLLAGLTGGLFKGGGGNCPCDPKCRKTEHFKDSDGNDLLEKCGNVVANSASAYSPDGDPTKNNENEVAETLGKIATKVGEELCIPNAWDLTEMIKDVKRLGEMADRFSSAKDADWPELWSELVYTFETVEKAFKKTDNNITKVESIERKLIDSQHRLINKLMVGNTSIISQTLLSIVTTSKAIRDVYKYVAKLDATKNGGRAGVTVTDSLSAVFENIVKIAKLNGLSKLEANFITKNFLESADKEWKDLNPAKDLVSLTDFVLGLIPKDLPASFDKCTTKNDKNKVLKDSLESRINSPVPESPESLTLSKLPQSVTDNPNLSSLLDQITYEQGRSKSGEANC